MSRSSVRRTRSPGTSIVPYFLKARQSASAEPIAKVIRYNSHARLNTQSGSFFLRMEAADSQSVAPNDFALLRPLPQHNLWTMKIRLECLQVGQIDRAVIDEIKDSASVLHRGSAETSLHCAEVA